MQNVHHIQGEWKNPDTFAANLNNKGVSFFLLTLYMFVNLGILYRQFTIGIGYSISGGVVNTSNMHAQ